MLYLSTTVRTIGSEISRKCYHHVDIQADLISSQHISSSVAIWLKEVQYNLSKDLIQISPGIPIRRLKGVSSRVKLHIYDEAITRSDKITATIPPSDKNSSTHSTLNFPQSSHQPTNFLHFPLHIYLWMSIMLQRRLQASSCVLASNSAARSHSQAYSRSGVPSLVSISLSDLQTLTNS